MCFKQSKPHMENFRAYWEFCSYNKIFAPLYINLSLQRIYDFSSDMQAQRILTSSRCGKRGRLLDYLHVTKPRYMMQVRYNHPLPKQADCKLLGKHAYATTMRWMAY